LQLRVNPIHRPFHSLKIYLRSMKAIPKSPYMRHPVTTRNISLKTSKMDAQLQRTATAACSGSANFGQVMATSRRVNLGDFDCCYLVMGDYFREDDAMLGRQPAQRR
jgi:hypothetical protein